MNRRTLLKSLASLPLVGLVGCGQVEPEPECNCSDWCIDTSPKPAYWNIYIDDEYIGKCYGPNVTVTSEQ